MYVKGIFRDLDELLMAVEGWNLEFLPLQKGRFSSCLVQLGLSQTQIGSADFFQKVEQKGITPNGFRTFVVPKTDRVNYYWRGKNIRGNMLSLFPPNGELYSVSNESFSVYTISFSDYIIEEALKLVRSLHVEQLFEKEVVWTVHPLKNIL